MNEMTEKLTHSTGSGSTPSRVEGLKPYAPLFLRLGLAVVFVLFGLQKLSFPSQGTAEIQQVLTSAVTGQSLVSLAVASAMNYYMGLFELMLGLALLSGKMLRYAAPLGALLVLVIFISVTFRYGMNTEDKTLLLDAALIGGALALWMLNSEKWKNAAPLLLRVGMALSFALLGYQKIAAGAVLGWAECAIAVLLLVGFMTRYIAPLAALFVVWSLFEAVGARGFLVQGMLPDPTLSRDIGVIGGALALWALGAGKWSVDGKKEEATPLQ